MTEAKAQLMGGSMLRAASLNMMMRGPAVAFSPDEPIAAEAGGEGAASGDDEDLDLGGVEAAEPDDEGEELEDDDQQDSEKKPSKPAAVETEEVEIDGEKHVIPKALKAAFLRTEDYTRKTQAIAAERSEIEKTRQELVAQRAQQIQASDEELDARASLRGLAAQIATYDAYTPQEWRAAYDADPGGTKAAEVEWAQLRRQHEQLTGVLETKAQERAKAAEESLAKQRETATQSQQAFMAEISKIPGWSDQLEQKLSEMVIKDFGVTPEYVGQVTDPVFVKLAAALHEAKTKLGQQSRAQSHVKAQEAQPAAKVVGSAPAVKDPTRMSTDEWMRNRNKQLEKKGRR